MDFCFLLSDILNALLRMSKIFIGLSEWCVLTGTRFHNDNQYELSLNRITSTIQKSNTPIKTVVTTIPMKNKVIFGMGIFYTAYRLKVLRQAENECAPDVPRGQFWLRHL